MIRSIFNKFRAAIAEYVSVDFEVKPWTREVDPRDGEIADLKEQIRELEIAATRVCDEVLICGVPCTFQLDGSPAVDANAALRSLHDLLRERAFEAAPRETAYPYF